MSCDVCTRDVFSRVLSCLVKCSYSSQLPNVHSGHPELLLSPQCWSLVAWIRFQCWEGLQLPFPPPCTHQCSIKFHGGACVMMIMIMINRQSDTSLHCETMDVWLVHHVLCLFTTQLLLVLIAPTPEGRPGWGNLDGWLNTKIVWMWLEHTKGQPSQY